jgi:hypothetical protein
MTETVVNNMKSAVTEKEVVENTTRIQNELTYSPRKSVTHLSQQHNLGESSNIQDSSRCEIVSLQSSNGVVSW